MPGGRGGMCVLWGPGWCGGLGNSMNPLIPFPLQTSLLHDYTLPVPTTQNQGEIPKPILTPGLKTQHPTGLLQQERRSSTAQALSSGWGWVDPPSPNPAGGARWPWLPLPPELGCVCAPGRFVIPPRREQGVPLGAALRPGSHRAAWGGCEQRGPSAQWGTDFTPFACPIRIIVQLIINANESWPSPTKKTTTNLI